VAYQRHASNRVQHFGFFEDILVPFPAARITTSMRVPFLKIILFRKEYQKKR